MASFRAVNAIKDLTLIADDRLLQSVGLDVRDKLIEVRIGHWGKDR
jgi:hypothetical protein